MAQLTGTPALPPVDLWITQARYPQPHRPINSSKQGGHLHASPTGRLLSLRLASETDDWYHVYISNQGRSLVTNEAKRNIESFALLIAIVASVLIMSFAHFPSGETFFAPSSPYPLANAKWTENIVEVAVVWVVFIAAKSTVLRPS